VQDHKVDDAFMNR